MATWPSEVAKISLRHKHYVTNGSETKRNGQPWVLMSRVLRPTKHIIGHIGDPWVLLNWNKQELSSCWDGRPCRHKRHGPKSGGGAAVLLSVAGAGSTSSTVYSGPRPTSVSRGILIHPTVWPQYTNVTDWQTGQTTFTYHRANCYLRSPKK